LRYLMLLVQTAGTGFRKKAKMTTPTLHDIAKTLDALHQQISALRAVEDKAQREATLAERLQAVVDAMRPLGAHLVICKDGSGYVAVEDAEGNPFTSFLAVFGSINDLARIDPTTWPSFEALVRGWECARPTPRAGDYRDRHLHVRRSAAQVHVSAWPACASDSCRAASQTVPGISFRWAQRATGDRSSR